MNIEATLQNQKSELNSLLGEPFRSQKALELDLSPNNPDISALNFRDPKAFEDWTANQLKKHQAEIAVGRYLEERVIYEQGEYAGRCVHLGLDIGLPSGTPLYAPTAGVLESYVDHLGDKDYGPTLLLKHTLEGIDFYVLYGHLSRESRSLYSEHKQFEAGELIAWVGHSDENGGWPPHVHVQCMKGIKVESGSNYQGVVSIADMPLEKDNHYDSKTRIGSGSNYQGVISIADMPLEKDNHFDPKLLLANSLSWL